MRAQAWLLLLCVLLAACGTATPSTGVTPSQATSAATTPEPGSAAGATATGAVPLTIVSPEDESTVNAPEVEVRGLAVPNGIITLNDEIAVADENGEFSAVVPLTEGPNVIQITVSDLEGNETILELTITYDPAS